MVTQKNFSFWIFSVLALTFFVYCPVMRNYFATDDFVHLAFNKENGFTWKTIFTPVNEHLSPLLRMLFQWEFHLFQFDSTGYYTVNIFFHLLNVFLTIIVFSRLFKDRNVGLLAGLIFGISCAHWRAVAWMSTQGQLMATLWFLLSLLSFIVFLERERNGFLGLSAISHLFMLFSFTVGFAVPILFYSLYLSYCYHEKRRSLLNKTIWLSGVKVVAPFVFNIVLLLSIRRILLPEGLSFLKGAGGWEGIKANLPEAAFFLKGILLNTLGCSYTGCAAFKKSCDYLVLYMGMVFIVIMLSIDWSKQGIRKHWAYLLSFLIGVLIMFSLPILPRIPWGFSWFVTRSRYAYAPGILAAAVMAVCLRHIRYFRPVKGIKKLLKLFFLCFFIFAGIVNIRVLSDHIKRTNIFTFSYHCASQRYIKNLKKFIAQHQGQAVNVLDIPFSTGYAGWSVPPGILARIYLSGSDLKRVHFIAQEEISIIRGQIFCVVRSDGFLYQVPKEKPESLGPVRKTFGL